MQTYHTSESSVTRLAHSGTLDHQRVNLNDSNDYVALEVSYDGGSNWNEIARYAGGANESSFTSESYSLGAGSLSANTQIRFLTPSIGMTDSRYVFFDYVQIQCFP